MDDSKERVPSSSALEWRPPSVESRELTRHWVLSLFTVPRQHFQSKMSRWKNCTRKVTFQDVTVNTIVVAVDDQPVLT